MRQKQAGTGGKFQREKSAVVSIRLSPMSIALLNELATEYGGAGRAIQVACEVLSLRHRTKSKSIFVPDEILDTPMEMFSFAAFPRTLIQLARLGEVYGTERNIIRACIRQLYELVDEESSPRKRDA